MSVQTSSEDVRVVERRSKIRWTWIVAALVLWSVFIAVAYIGRVGSVVGDARPVGSIDDIARLKERTDLNVLFILIDTVRSDRLSAYGYERDTTPNLARYAGEGVRFSRQLSQSSWTKSSMASMWTSLYPIRSGITRFDDVLPDAALMPAEVLREAGFKTVGLYRNGWVSPNFGFAQGFDVYTRPLPRPPAASVRRENPTITEVGSDEDVIEAAMEYFRINGKEKWFLYLHMMDVHEYLYDEESALFGGQYSDVYDNSIRRVDGLIEILLQNLSDVGLAGKTLVVITSDHGEAFRERGVEGHARRVYKETTEVPFILGLPFRLDPGIVVTARTRNVDIWPTLLDLLALPAATPSDGRSRVPDVLAAGRGETDQVDDTIGIAYLDTTWGLANKPSLPTIAVSQGPYRYVRIPNADAQSESLFDSTNDPKELTNQSDSNPEKLGDLRALADGHLAEEPAWGEAPTRTISEMELNQLRALGYALP